MNNILQHFVTAFFDLHLKGQTGTPRRILDVVPNGKDAVFAVDRDGNAAAGAHLLEGLQARHRRRAGARAPATGAVRAVLLRRQDLDHQRRLVVGLRRSPRNSLIAAKICPTISLAGLSRWASTHLGDRGEPNSAPSSLKVSEMPSEQNTNTSPASAGTMISS